MINQYIGNTGGSGAIQSFDACPVANDGNQLRLQAASGAGINKRLQVGPATGN